MKRDPDLIRDLMLALEAAEGAELLKLPALSHRSTHEVDHHFRLLMEAGLAAAGYTSSDGRKWVAVRLTWTGHDYLDKIRDPQIWRYTKSAMNRPVPGRSTRWAPSPRPRSWRSWKRWGSARRHNGWRQPPFVPSDLPTCGIG